MNQGALAANSQKRLVKLAIRSAKAFIAARGIHATTRKGSKELELLIKKIAGQSLATREQATQIGQNVGEKLVELSGQKAKNNLDKGVVRQLAAQKEIFSLSVSSKNKFSSTLQQMDEKSSSELATSAIVSKSVEAVLFAEETDEAMVEEIKNIVEESDEKIAEKIDEPIVDKTTENFNDEIIENSIDGIVEELDEEIIEDSDEEIVEDSIEEIVEALDEKIAEKLDEEITEDSDEEIVEILDEDVLDESLPELQEESQEERPIELFERSEAIAIDFVQSHEEKLVDY